MKLITTLPADKKWIDYSSLSTYLRCPRQYYWRHIQHVTTADEKVALINGDAYHGCKAEYYIARAKGADHKQAMTLAMKVLVVKMSAITIEDPKRNVSVALRTMENYFNLWEHDSYSTVIVDGEPLVEIAGAVDLGEFVYVFKIDRVTESALLGVAPEETKTTTIVGNRWGMRLEPNLQIDGYVSAIAILTDMKPTGAVLDVIPVTDKPTKATNPFRLTATRGPHHVEEWLENLSYTWQDIQNSAARGYWTKNTESCVPLIGFSCDCQELCKTNPAPHKSDKFVLPAEYKIEKWEPLQHLNVN